MKNSLKTKSKIKTRPVESGELRRADRALIGFASVLLQVPEEVILAKILGGRAHSG